MNAIVKRLGEAIMRRKPFRILIRNEVDVILELNGRELDPMHPDMAIDIAVGLNHAGRLIKERKGMAKTWHGIARLTDAEADERQMQVSKDGTAAFGRVA